MSQTTTSHEDTLYEDIQLEDDGGLAVEEAETKPKKPSRYLVVLLNDDYTPMEFVIHVLEAFFGMPHSQATHVMLQVHQEGKGICGAFPRDVAETKVAQVIRYARQHQHPLLCVMERV
uniref:ATP-dependent Clp protease adapter protein ClpS n=1 Tax=Candidatus Kentrum sp. MB TaxID=2138164 RepID=A0A450XJE9_9GAMM|nr:MAG: ATP-dependent Clp protease adaptor protein ClpS [Candidatus Kentron sp. MB]